MPTSVTEYIEYIEYIYLFFSFNEGRKVGRRCFKKWQLSYWTK